MYPPVFETLTAVPDIVSALQGANNIVKIFPIEAPQGTKAPYVVWNTPNGFPQNYLGNVPDLDQFSTQIDVYADTLEQVRDIGKLLRDAIEPVAYITAWLGDGKDFETKLMLLSFDVDWQTDRT
jgi:hypothetical protein